MSIKPLSWRKDLEKPTGMSRFFQDMPLFGAVRRRRRAVHRQIATRNAAECASLWDDKPEEKAIAIKVAEIAQAYLGWPNANFIPTDPCEIIFSPAWDGLEVVCVLMEIGDQFHLDGEDLLQAINSTFGHLVEYIGDSVRSKRDLA